MRKALWNIFPLLIVMVGFMMIATSHLLYLGAKIEDEVRESFSEVSEYIDSHIVIVKEISQDSVLELRYDTVSIKRATRYNPSEEQCDKTPLLTADQSFIDTVLLKEGKVKWVALSWDLIYDEHRQRVAYRDWAWKGKIRFGDTIYVSSETKPHLSGDWIVHDVMNSRYRSSVDFLYHRDLGIGTGVCKDLIIKIKK